MAEPIKGGRGKVGSAKSLNFSNIFYFDGTSKIKYKNLKKMLCFIIMGSQY